MMIRQFKPLFGSCGVLILSLYCRGVLAADVAVKAASTNATTTTTTTSPNVPTVPNSQMLSAQLGNKQAMQGIFAMIGSLLLMVSLVWLLGVVLGKMGGKKPQFKKPLILGLVAIILIFIARHVVK
jgi:hypothetical protein